MTRKSTIAALAAALMVGGAGLALAQPAPGGPPPGGPGGPGMHRGDGPRFGPHHGPRAGGSFRVGEAFGRADANGDGKVSKEEGNRLAEARFTRSMPTRTAA